MVRKKPAGITSNPAYLIRRSCLRLCFHEEIVSPWLRWIESPCQAPGLRRRSQYKTYGHPNGGVFTNSK
jgi:hypothetical protein